jgi:predicted nucleic acid-binding protein
MPTPDRFFDSNILLYLIGSDPAKAARAEVLVEAGGHISVQVLNEIANVARRKLQWPWDRIEELTLTLSRLLDVQPLTMQDHSLALTIARTRGFSLYNSLIIASALAAKCSHLFTEDLHHGQIILDRLQIINPFKD